MGSNTEPTEKGESAITISYSKPGTQPPLFLAGSFSNWQPEEMQHSIDDQGQYNFTKDVKVEEGQEYQYKFRVGEGDWWLLNEDEPTVTDDVGNRNNLLKVPINEKSFGMDEITKKDSFTKPEATLELPAQNTEKLHVHVDEPFNRSDARTPDIASNAAEVADSAMILDRDTPTPPISDEEAGRIGYRRMSQTPIPEVAEIAAEVAESAAIIDRNNSPRIEMPRMPTSFDFDLPETPGSGAVTPDEDKVPLFAHECIQPPPGGFETNLPPKREHVKSKLSIQETAIDFDDPSLEEFPSERNKILEQVRMSQSRLPEDQTVVEGIPPSPVVRGRPHPELFDLPTPSPHLLERSPSLNSIPEGEEINPKEDLTSFPEGDSLSLSNGEPHLNGEHGEKEIQVQDARNLSDDQEVSGAHHFEPTEIAPLNETLALDGNYMEPEPIKLPATPFIFDNSRQLGEEPQHKQLVTPEDGPNIVVEPATPGTSLRRTDTDPFDKSGTTAKTSATENKNGRSQLTSRKQAVPPERPLTPTSMRSAGKDAKSRNFLKAFWRVVFVEWIGGLIMRLCGGDRQKALLATFALLLITIALAVYYSV